MNFIEGLLAPDCVVVPLEDLELGDLQMEFRRMGKRKRLLSIFSSRTAQAILLHFVGTHRCAEAEDTGAMLQI